MSGSKKPTQPPRHFRSFVGPVDEDNVITLTPEEQLEFWTALGQPPKLTAAQRRLGSLMRGED